MVQIPSFFHSIFKELSNEYSHTQIQVKTNKLWPQQVREEKNKLLSRNCRDQASCRDQETWSQPKKTVLRPKKTVSRPACCVATKNAGEN